MRERVAPPAPLAPGGRCDWGWWRQQPGGQGYRSWRLRICHRLPGHSSHSMVWSGTCETCLGNSDGFLEIFRRFLEFGILGSTLRSNCDLCRVSGSDPWAGANEDPWAEDGLLQGPQNSRVMFWEIPPFTVDSCSSMVWHIRIWQGFPCHVSLGSC